jgi:tetratricopeptide (TPR) repeat protein
MSSWSVLARLFAGVALVMTLQSAVVALPDNPAAPSPEEFPFLPPNQYLKNPHLPGTENIDLGNGRIFGKVGSLQSDSPEINEAIAKMDLRRWSEAIAALDRAIASNPSDPDGYFNRAIARLKREPSDTERAVADLDRAIAVSPDHAYAHYTRGYLRYSLGEYQSAVDDYSRALALKRDNPMEALFARGAARL